MAERDFDVRDPIEVMRSFMESGAKLGRPCRWCGATAVKTRLPGR